MRFAPFLMLALLAGCAPPPSANVGNAPTNVPPTNVPAANTAPLSSDASRVFPRSELKVATVTLKGKPFRLWIMDTDPKRQEGMMFLRDEDVEADQGMLFAFPDVQPLGEAGGFWMRNTYIPLDIIYLSPQGRVVNVGKGEPFNETNVPPTGTYQNVIELKGGTAARIGLKAGDRIELPKDLKPTSEPLKDPPPSL